MSTGRQKCCHDSHSDLEGLFGGEGGAEDSFLGGGGEDDLDDGGDDDLDDDVEAVDPVDDDLGLRRAMVSITQPAQNKISSSS